MINVISDITTLEEIKETFHTIIPDEISSALGIQGFHPPEYCAEKAKNETLSQGKKNLDCYAQYSHSSMPWDTTIKFADGDIIVKSGQVFSGAFPFNAFFVRFRTQQSPTKFKIEGKANTLFDLGFIQFGEKPDPEDDTKVVGDPSFLIDAEVFVPGVSSSTSGDSALGSFNALRLPKLLVNIQGAFTIPILKTHGMVKILFNAEGAHFEAGLKLFGLVNVGAKVFGTGS